MYCIVKNIHESHKILEIEDEENLKKENITIEASKKEFNNLNQKIIELEEKIKNESKKIDKLA